MAAEGRDMAKRESTAVGAPTGREDFFLTPPVDIFEDAEGITVHAEMPGVELSARFKVVNDLLIVEQRLLHEAVHFLG